MKRTLLVLLLSCLFLVPGVLYAQMKDEPGLVNPGFSPEFWDSLMNGKGGEPSLQHLLDSLGYDINVVTDLLPTEVWVTVAGQYREVMLAELAGYASQTSSGWYGHGSPADTHVIFSGANLPGDSVSFTITGCDSNGLFIKVPGTGEKSLPYVYYMEKRLNLDHKDHAKVYCSKKRPNEFIVAWEDSWDLGDADFNDLVLVYRTPNRPPVLVLPKNTNFLICEAETVCFDIGAYDDCGDTVSITKLEGPGVFDQNAGTCCFLPASVDSAYEFVFVATDLFGAADTDTFVITVELNQPPQITCPDDDSVDAGDRFVSSNFSTSDPKGSPVVNLCGITPTPTHMPIKVSRHVEWQTDCADAGKVFTICLEATDKCGAKDTCYFEVTVYNRPPQITCPDDDSVNAGDFFVSSDFSASDAKCDPVVNLCGITPTPTHMPIKVFRHVEWQTDCADAGKVFTICLETTDKCGVKDTCYFEVTVYDRPSQIACPDDDTVHSGHYLSGNFTVNDADGDSVSLVKAWVDPVGTGITNVTVHGGTGAVPTTGHVEFDADSLFPGDYIIYLEATSGCETKDTCSFLITIRGRPPVITSTPDTTAFVGVPYTYDVDATGIPVPTFTLITFPTGMTIDPNTGLIQWTPAAVGDANVCVEAANSAGADTQCFTISVAESAQVSILPDSLFIQCNHEDTLWIHLDEKALNLDSAFFKITYDDDFISPTNVIKGPALVPPGDFDLHHHIYPDSILISLAVLSSGFDGPGKILGIVFTANSDAVGPTYLTIEFSTLLDSNGQPIPHNTSGAKIQIDCSTSADGGDQGTSQNPSTYGLSQNYPNPYNPTTQIAYQLPQPGVVSLKIYNIKGELVRTLVNEYKPAGNHIAIWNGKDDAGIELASGIYLYRIQADKFTDSKKMILIK